jgi:hypothetical protein
MDKLFEVKFPGVSEIPVYAANKAAAVALARQYWAEDRNLTFRSAPEYAEAIPDRPYVWLHR